MHDMKLIYQFCWPFPGFKLKHISHIFFLARITFWRGHRWKQCDGDWVGGGAGSAWLCSLVWSKWRYSRHFVTQTSIEKSSS